MLLELANQSEYGLTGAGVYKRPGEKIEKAKRRFFVGNLYINRKCTGAMVGAHSVRRLQHVGNRFESRGAPTICCSLCRPKSIAEKVL